MNSPDKKSLVTIKNSDVDIIHSRRTKRSQPSWLANMSCTSGK
ncbi:hypothetical protein ECDEC5B_5541 [Escherichia coli DEC5B]|nr:hypothetical protein ECDEC5B_5541 [Escherichia coli DEC5B]